MFEILETQRIVEGEGSLTLLRTGGHSFLADLLAAMRASLRRRKTPGATAGIVPAAMPKKAPPKPVDCCSRTQGLPSETEPRALRRSPTADVLNTDRHALFEHDFIEALYRIQRARVTNPGQQLGNEAEQHFSVIPDIEIALNMPFHLGFDAAQSDEN